MGDDRPYRSHDGLLEIPVHWSLDDWPHLHWKPGPRRRVHRAASVPGDLAGRVRVGQQERRHVTYTMHPEVIGRGYRAQLLDTLIDANVRKRDGVVRDRTAMWQPS